jgi:hypothetical protein
VEKANARIRSINRELGDKEDELVRAMSNFRKVQREVDDLQAANDVLQRENKDLRAKAR